MLKVRPKETGSMFTRDGVRLDADIYRPEGEGEFPILLMRQPYGRAIASTVVYAHPNWYAAHGYIVIIQDVRGRGTSEGKFNFFSQEIEDGFDTLNWASQLPGSIGKIGMYGFSYQGMAQLYVAEHPNLKAICPAMIGYDLYSDWAYENGAFSLQANLGWAIQLAAETARLEGDETAFSSLYAASRNLPLNDRIPAYPQIIKDLAADSFYHDWISHPQLDDYWKKLSPKTLLKNVDLPMLHIGGWFDTFLRGTLNLYKNMASRSQFPQHLIIGPWAHLPWGRKVGSVDYGVEANSPVDELQIRWFDQFLKDKDTGLITEKPVLLFEMGSNQWRNFNNFPNNNLTSYFLASTGLASLREDAGRLIKDASISKVEDNMVHDPWRPVPTLGGHASAPSGSFDRSHIDCRSDVLIYTTAPLGTDFHLVGNVVVEIYCEADKPSFDLCAVLSEVQPNGSIYNITQGYIKVEPGQKTLPLKLSLQATCVKITEGNCLRLSISGACFPAYPVNPGTGSKLTETRLIDAQIITINVLSGGNYPSKILLPVDSKHL